MLIRHAVPADLSAMRAVMRAAIDELQRGFLSTGQIAASRAVMGLDTQLVEDRTYFVVEDDGRIAGCGGWSCRATLFGGDHSTALRDPRRLDPATEPARIRAMYTHPAFARRGVGGRILSAAEAAARDAGFRAVELMATLAGEPLYLAHGYRRVALAFAAQDGVEVPLVRMDKSLDPQASG